MFLCSRMWFRLFKSYYEDPEVPLDLKSKTLYYSHMYQRCCMVLVIFELETSRTNALNT